jgi:predicted  nucleic acid-binding Zn-ribbon protein
MAKNHDLTIRVKVKDDGSGKLKVVGDSIKNLDTQAKSSTKSFTGMTGAFVKGQFIYDALKTAVLATGRAFRSIGEESLALSGKFGQTMATIEQLGANMGWTADQINATIDEIRSYDKDIATAAQITKSLILAQIDASKATEILSSARDVAASRNRNSNDVIQTLTQSILAGNVALLNGVDVTLSMNSAVQNYARETGIAEKVVRTQYRGQAILNEFLKEGEKATGAYDSAMNSWWKQANSVKDGMGEVKLILGQMLDQAMFPILKETRKLMWEFRRWALVNGELRPELKQLAETIGKGLFTAFLVVKDAVKGAIAVFQGFKTGINALIAYLKPAIDTIRNLLSWLNPFARHSPSLVEQVNAGVDEIVAKYKKVDEIAQPLKKFEGLMRNATDALDEQKRKVDDAKDKLEAYKETVDDLNDELDRAKEHLNALNKTKLEGFGEFNDDLFNIEQQIKQMELDKLLAEQAGASESEIERIDEAIGRLESERDIMKLRFEIETDPMLKALDDMKNEFEGASKEMGFDELKGQFESTYDNIDTLTERLEGAKIAMESQQETVGMLEGEYDVLKEAVDKLSSSIKEASGSLTGSGGAGGGLDEAMLAMPEPIAVAGGAMESLTSTFDVAKNRYEEFKEGVGAGWARIRAWLEEKGFIDQFRMAWENLKKSLDEKLMPSLGRLLATLEPYLPLLGKLAGAVGVVLFEAFIILMEGLAKAIDILSILIDVIAWLADKINIVLVPVMEFLIGLFETFVGWIQKAVTWVQKLIEKLNSLDMGKLAKAGFNAISPIDFRASGGPVSAGKPYIVGEKGPELIIPNQNGTVIPNHQLAGAGGMNLSVVVTGNNISNNMDLRSVAREVGDELVRQLKQFHRI